MEKTKEEIAQEIIEKLPSVQNMTSSNGNDIPNQFEINWANSRLFQSYRSPIALLRSGKVYIFKDWNYSKTTGKYRNEFLGETKKETLAKLKSGEYIAVDFNVEDL